MEAVKVDNDLENTGRDFYESRPCAFYRISVKFKMKLL